MDARPGDSKRRQVRRLALLACTVVALLAAPAGAQAAGLGCSEDAAGTEDRSSFTEDILAKTNAHRTARGMVALQLDPMLTKAALWKARDMGRRDYFSHDDPITGGAVRTPWQRLIDCGYDEPTSSRAENIAAGQTSGGAFAQAWIDSPGHRANIETAAFRYIGIATAYVPGSTYGTYSVQMFSSKSSGQVQTPAPASPTTTSLTLVADGSFVDLCVPDGTSGTSFEPTSSPAGVAITASRTSTGCMRVTAPAGTEAGIATLGYRAVNASGTSAAVTLRVTVEAPRTLAGVDPTTVTVGTTTSLRGSNARVTSRPCRTRAAVRGRCWSVTVTVLLRTATGAPLAGQRVAISRVDSRGKVRGLGAVATNARGVAKLSRAIRPPARGTSTWLKRTYSAARLHFAGTSAYAPSIATARVRLR